ncbi:MAG TPA: endonuclease/exonuclease/phosphatase family protein [Candidatus Poseidoniaceae archaeon]|nr:endonuclease/exonuclease/phosphatase family protein [Candidatus Poseidoniaceae archaeon]
MGDYSGYLQGLSLAAILILAPIALQSLLSNDAEVVYVLVPGEEEVTTIYIENNTTNDDARGTELNRSEVARIATFNIKVFGETKMGKPAVVEVLVDTILNYDLVAVQEIKDMDQTVPYDFLDAINAKSNTTWDMVLSPRSGLQDDDQSSQEQYAFYYNTSVFRAMGNGTLHNDSTNDSFQREPFIAQFQLLDTNGTDTGFDLSLITVHTKPAEALSEINALPHVVDTYLENNPNESEVVILGDFNAACTYVSSNELSNSPLAHSNYTWLIENNVDTTVSDSYCAYDRIVTNGDLDGRLVGTWGVDTSFSDSEISDHYPVWFDIKK